MTVCGQLYRNCVSAKCDHVICDVAVHVMTSYVTVYFKCMPQTLYLLCEWHLIRNRKHAVWYLSVFQRDLSASLMVLNTRIVIYKRYILDRSWMNAVDMAYCVYLWPVTIPIS